MTNKQRLILNDSIDDVDIFLADRNASKIEFNLVDFIEFKTVLIKEKYNITDAELTIAFLENIEIANEASKASRKSVEYKQKRQAEYPSLLELTVALYDTDDKSAVEAKRAEVKAKYPKPE